MMPAAFPGLPATIFPALFASTTFPVGGLDAVDITAAIAALVWGLGGLVALRIAISMNRDDERPQNRSSVSTPNDPRHGFRDAA